METTQTAKHTPGPWGITECAQSALGGTIFGPKLNRIAIVVGGCGRRKTKLGQANARLIAAAPDLLAACEALVNIEGHQRGRCSYCGDHVSKHGPRCPLHLARAAIARARGQA